MDKRFVKRFKLIKIIINNNFNLILKTAYFTEVQTSFSSFNESSKNYKIFLY